jgi:hypothetical protein
MSFLLLRFLLPAICYNYQYAGLKINLINYLASLAKRATIVASMPGASIPIS